MSRKSAEIVPKSAETVAVGAHVFSIANKELRTADGQIVPLRSQSAEVLAALAARPGEIVRKSELVEAVWADIAVTDDSLVQCIADIRRALGDGGHSIVQTFPRKGYRLSTALDSPVAGGLARAVGVLVRQPRRLALMAITVPVVVAVGVYLMAPAGPHRSDMPKIAVLALDDLSPPGNDTGYLSDAIGEGIITELSRFSEFFVIARNSSFSYRDAPTDVRTIAGELGVQYVLEGSQQKHGDRLRVTVQLIDAVAGTDIWSETYDRKVAELFAVQDEIVRSVASAVGGRIAFHPPPAGGLPAVSAMQYHLEARRHMRRFTPEDTQIALDLNRKAIAADPTSPFGYIGSAFAYLRAYTYGWTDVPQDQALERARKAADKALVLSPDNYDAYYTRGYVHLAAGEQEQAIARFRRAIELNPSAANVMAALSKVLVYQGKADEAIELLKGAMRLDPHHPDWFKWNLAWAQWAAGQCEAGLSTIQAMTSMPNMARRELANIYICLGRQNDAEATIAQLLEGEPGYTIGKLRASHESRYTEKEILERVLDGLRRAGLPQ